MASRWSTKGPSASVPATTRSVIRADDRAEVGGRDGVDRFALADRASVLADVEARGHKARLAVRAERPGEGTVRAVVIDGAPCRRELEANVLAAPRARHARVAQQRGRRRAGTHEHERRAGRETYSPAGSTTSTLQATASAGLACTA